MTSCHCSVSRFFKCFRHLHSRQIHPFSNCSGNAAMCPSAPQFQRDLLSCVLPSTELFFLSLLHLSGKKFFSPQNLCRTDFLPRSSSSSDLRLCLMGCVSCCLAPCAAMSLMRCSSSQFAPMMSSFAAIPMSMGQLVSVFLGFKVGAVVDLSRMMIPAPRSARLTSFFNAHM